MSVKSAARVLDIVELFADERRPFSLTELSRALRIPAASCLGLIRTMGSRGYVYEVSRRAGFYPTGRLAMKAARISAHDPVVARVSAKLAGLRDRTGETVVLAKLLGSQVLYLDVVESRQIVRYIPEVGQARPVLANSLGKAMLSVLDEDARRAILDETAFEAFTDRTILDRGRLEVDIRQGQCRGWQTNLGESIADLGAVARPIRIAAEPYAVSVAGPLARIEASLARHADALQEACTTIESEFATNE